MLGPLLALLASCASLTEKECRTADWREIGLRDGHNGQPRSRAADHAESCGKIGVRIDEPVYFAAREEGLKQYCTPQRGLETGLSGFGYSRVCPADVEAAFLERYRAGREVHEQRRRISDLDSRRRELEFALGRSRSDEQRHQLREDLRRLDFDMRRERDFLWMLESRLGLPPRTLF